VVTRDGGSPNTSDDSDALPREPGRELFDVLGVPRDQPGPDNAGAALEHCVSDDLAGVRPDLLTGMSRSFVTS
jgi:hypothetical protein